jgi:5-methylcytosine-specific restriction endonuclease McrA
VPHKLMRQIVLFCRCGPVSILARGLCARCYAADRVSHIRFGGLRERAIVRDGRRCTGCGSEDVIVHHRRRGPGRDLDRLATLCPVCHARIHKTLRLRFGRLTPWMRELWREQHPGLAEQLELPLDGVGVFEEVMQEALFHVA